MGGNAIKALGFEPVRLDSSELQALELRILSELAFHGIYAEGIPRLPSKESHGDLDLLVTSSNLPQFPEERGRVKNGSVSSLAWALPDCRIFQVDLNYFPAERLRLARSYFAYGDLGNMLGRAAMAMRLKLGTDGLSYRLSKDRRDHISLSKDWNQSLEVLGYDPERWHQGFSSEEEVFEYVVSSPYFDVSFFLEENLNHHKRKRQLVRPVYKKFLEWLGRRELPEPEKRDPLELFPWLEGKIEEVEAKKALSKERRLLFNGSKVMALLPLQGRELGDFLTWMRQGLDYEWFGSLSESEQNAHIKEQYEQHYTGRVLGN